MRTLFRPSMIGTAGITCIFVALTMMFVGCTSDDDNGPTGNGPAVEVGWYLQDIEFEGYRLRAAAFSDDQRGWVVGPAGVVLRTIDGGANWMGLSATVSARLWDVAVLGSNTVFAVGDGGEIIYTTDGGVSFQPARFDVPEEDLYGVVLIDGLHAWVVGDSGTIAKTTNGGRSWSDFLDTLGHGPTTQNLRDIFFIGEETGIIVGESGTILRTPDGGTSWTEPVSPTGLTLWSVFFVDNSGWAVGDSGTIIHSTDGGVTWSDQTSETMTEDLSDVAFASTSVGWAIGKNGTILKTSNGGETWLAMTSRTYHDLYGLALANGGIWAVGSFAILRSDDGNSWENNPSSVFTLNTLEQILFVDSDHGWAAGFGGVILRTTDGGQSWDFQAYRQARDSWFFDGAFIDGSEGWLVGMVALPPYNGLIIHTSDSGNTWNAQLVPGDSIAISSVIFTDELTGWACGGGWEMTSSHKGAIYSTEDGGDNWLIANSPGVRLWDIDFVGSDHGWVVGHDGFLMHSTDGGNVWSSEGLDTLLVDRVRVDTTYFDTTTVIDTILYDTTWAKTVDTTMPLYGVTFIDEASGWVIGAFGSIYYTSDNGVTWTKQSSGTDSDLREITFIDANTGWIVGADGIILHTSDGGSTWREQGTQTSNVLLSIILLDADNGWAVGEDGTILKTTTGGQ